MRTRLKCQNNHSDKNGKAQMIKCLALFFSSVLILSSCSNTKKSIQKEIIHDTVIHTEYINKIQYDSIYMHDSIYMYMQGDTLYKTIYKDVYKYKYLTDTVLLTDTVFVTKTGEKETVKVDSLSVWKLRIIIGVFILIILVVLWLYFKGSFLKLKIR